MKRQYFHTQCGSLLRYFSRIDLYFFFSLGALTTLRMRYCMHTHMISCFSRVRLFAILWTVPHKPPLSMGFSRQEYWSGLLCPPPGELPDWGIEPVSPVLQVNPLLLSHWRSPNETLPAIYSIICIITITFTISTLTADGPNRIFLSRPYAAVTHTGGGPE